MVNYKINSKYLKDWENNNLFVEIHNKEEFEILEKVSNRLHNDYKKEIIYYCLGGYSNFGSIHQIFQIYDMNTIKFSEFFDLGENCDILNYIQEIQNIYEKL